MKRFGSLLVPWLLPLVMGGISGCDRQPEPDESTRDRNSSASEPKTGRAAPKRLALPPSYEDAGADSEHRVDLSSSGPSSPPPPVPTNGRCPTDMVLVAGTYCIDRYEVSLVDARAYRPLSPHYPPDRRRVNQLFELWTKRAPASKRALGRSLLVPEPPSFELSEDFVPLARSDAGVVPAGYLTLHLAAQACQSAGKRLCHREEWVRACRGEQDQQFPYGTNYRDGQCNVHRKSHPANLLHGDSSTNHLDPRLGLTQDEDGPLLRKTGETMTCVSTWGSDGIFDMVGNLDEWIDDPTGIFVGGFYSRATRDGCESSIDVHAPGYLDYSLGTRCCKDAR